MSIYPCCEHCLWPAQIAHETPCPKCQSAPARVREQTDRERDLREGLESAIHRINMLNDILGSWSGSYSKDIDISEFLPEGFVL